MVSIYFVGPYKPIMCGIADFTSFITARCPSGKWGVISFNLERYGVPLVSEGEIRRDCVWYGIPDRESYSDFHIMKGLDELGADRHHSVLWFQHEFGIWPDDIRFISMLRNLEMPKIVTVHTMHFQSPETPYGLRRNQYNFLGLLLKCVDAITVFSHGVYSAVTRAFPEYREKVYILKHGVHLYPEISRLSRREAKARLDDYLIYESDVDLQVKEKLHRQRIFLDPRFIVIGQSGFLTPAKGSEQLYVVRKNLQKMLRKQRIAAVRIGAARDDTQRLYARKLRRKSDGRPEYLVETWLPQSMLPVAQRAFNINFYWPVDCTQSGILAHALGTGAIIAGRDLEGVGETLKSAFEPADKNLKNLQTKMAELILNPKFAEMVEEKALDYAREFSWDNQVTRHYELAEHILSSSPAPSTPYLPVSIGAPQTLVEA
jgi:hypothetical protein